MIATAESEPDAPPALGRQLFPLGRVGITAGASAAMPDHWEAIAALHRHSIGDWGQVSRAERETNNDAVEHGSLRIFSEYTARSGVKFWIVTESDRLNTTILLPEEY